jgi:dolichol-phosphate mannosyltransferase
MNEKEQTKKLSVVIPCYNEEDTLPTLFFKLDHLFKLIDANKYIVEIIIVDDGSIDKTSVLLKIKYDKNPNVKIIKHDFNKGFGAALKTGLLNATGDFVVTIDADTNYDQQEIPEIVSFLTDEYDLVTASPLHPQGNWHYPFHRFICTKVLVLLYRFVLKGKGDNIYTFTSGFRVYRKEILKDILPEANDFLATVELLIRALIKGYRIKEYPTVVYERKFGVSKLKQIITIINHLKFLLKIYRGRIN